MSPGTEVTYERLSVRLDGVDLGVALSRRSGDRAPIVFLHGFGSTKEDYVDIAYDPGFAGRPFLAYDAPGCGETVCADLSKVSIPRTAFSAGRWSLIPPPDAERFFEDVIERTRRSPFFSSALYAANLRHKVRPGAVRGIFESMVDLSDHGDLMSWFLAQPFPRMFMYGEQNSSLSYLPTLAADGVELAEIPKSGHFPMYSNPVAMWQRIAEFQPGGGSPEPGVGSP